MKQIDSNQRRFLLNVITSLHNAIERAGDDASAAFEALLVAAALIGQGAGLTREMFAAQASVIWDHIELDDSLRNIAREIRDIFGKYN